MSMPISNTLSSRYESEPVADNFQAPRGTLLPPVGFSCGPNDGFQTRPTQPLWLPQEMRVAPQLDAAKPAGRIESKFALLINPFYPKDPHGSFGKHVLVPALALSSIAAATPRDWRIECWDENLLQGPPPSNPLPELVGITLHLTFACRAYELARWYRQRGSKVVLGGLHVFACPDEAAAHADAIALGDGVQLWPEILRDAARGELRPRYTAGFERNYDFDPPPRRELLPRASFLSTASIIATRGCHNRCGFCYLATDGLHLPFRARDPRDVARQLAESGEPYAVFLDNNLGANRGYLWRLCRELRPVNIIWSAAVSLDVTDDPELIRAMALAGCTGVFIGFETLSDANLAHAGKRTPRTADYARRVRLFHDNGIQVNGSFVVGFDEDRRDCFEVMAQWSEENRLECATFHILTPYPGTPLFRQFEREGRLLHRDWDLYDTAHVVFRPKHMTPDELAHGYDWLYRRLFSLRSIWQRRPRHASAVAPYLAMALLYKRSNRLWHFLIKHRLVNAVWSPLVQCSRWRHAAFRRRLERVEDGRSPEPAATLPAASNAVGTLV
jgi:radical SAM superfamily enzyme YgiQ (UPF0313 family)